MTTQTVERGHCGDRCNCADAIRRIERREVDRRQDEATASAYAGPTRRDDSSARRAPTPPIVTDSYFELLGLGT